MIILYQLETFFGQFDSSQKVNLVLLGITLKFKINVINESHGVCQ